MNGAGSAFRSQSVSFDARLASRDFDVTLRLRDGETLAVLGPNGAGKSTLLGMLAGLVKPDSGSAALGDRILFDLQGARRTWLAPHRRGVALLAQSPLLFPHLSVRSNVAFGPRSSGASRAVSAERAERWLAETETLELADRRPGQLSGGQAQRVAIARALAAEPRLLLLDEPLSALDVEVAPTIRRMLRRVIAGRTTVLVTHDVLDAFLLADRVLVIGHGRVVESGSTSDVLERPRAAFTAELAGVSLVTGRRTASGLVTDDGLVVAAADTSVAEQVRDGSRVTAALRPSAVRVALDDGVGGRRSDSGGHVDGENVIHATVRDLEPHGDLIRVRTEWLSADIAPRRMADLDLAPGSRIILTFSPGDVALYPA